MFLAIIHFIELGINFIHYLMSTFTHYASYDSAAASV